MMNRVVHQLWQLMETLHAFFAILLEIIKQTRDHVFVGVDISQIMVHVYKFAGMV